MNKQGKITMGVVLWVAFVCAAVATMLFFATFDPKLLANVATFPMTLDRLSGYSIGFLLFWFLLMANGALVAWLLKTPKGKKASSDIGD